MQQRKLSATEIRRRKRAGAYHDGGKPLTAKRVAALKGDGRYRDGGGYTPSGLYLQVRSGAKSWVLRFEQHGRERFMGLVSLRIVGLKEARERAKLARLRLLDGVDPIEQRRAAKSAAQQAAVRKLTFSEAAQRYFDQNESKWRNANHRNQFLSTLRSHVFPTFGNMDVATIDTPDVLRALEPIWKTKSITADRVRSRVERVLDWCMVRGHRPPGVNPAKWPGHLDQVLPAPRAVAPIAHHAAMPYADLPAFMRELRLEEKTVAARALEFLITCAARTGEVIGAVWSEVDLDSKTWTVPGKRMKGGRDHRVPLSDAAVSLLRALPREKGNPFVFIGHRPGSGLSRMALPWIMSRLGQDGMTTVHGFRSSFRDWAGETTAFAHDICEAALAHVRGDHSVQAYARGDLFDKRRKLMEAWARYCASPPAPKRQRGGNVVTMRERA
jgi:integrase